MEELYTMKLGYAQAISDDQYLTKVPGGWVFHDIRYEGCCFVPNSNEFKPKAKSAPKKNPTLKEVLDYFKEKGYNQAIGKKAWNYYEALKWCDGTGKRVKSWKAKMIAVWMRDEFKVKPVKVETVEEANEEVRLALL